MKNLIDKIKSLEKGTIIRTLAFFATMINTVVLYINKTSGWYIGLSLAAFMISAIIAWWETQNFTQAAKDAEKVYRVVKDGKVTSEEVNALIQDRDK